MRLSKADILQLVLKKASDPRLNEKISSTAFEYIIHVVDGAYKQYGSTAQSWSAALTAIKDLPVTAMIKNTSANMPKQCEKLIKIMFGSINSDPHGTFTTEPALKNADIEDLLYYVHWMGRFKKQAARTLADACKDNA